MRAARPNPPLGPIPLTALLAALLGGALAAAPALAQPRPPERETREAVVANELDIPIRELYAIPGTAPAGTPDAAWGPDRLGADMLAPGATLRLRLARQPCLWALRAILTDDTVEERRLDLCRTPRVTFGDASLPLREVTIVNDADMTLREFYATPEGTPPAAGPQAAGPQATGRGPDRLLETLPPGETLRLRLGRHRACVFATVAVMEDGSEVAARLDSCRAPRLALADPATTWREATARNRSGRAIIALNAVPAGRPEPLNWGPDRLNEAGLPDDAAFRLRLRLPSCAADLRATYEGGAAEEKRAVDLCRDPAVTFDGSGIPRPVERPLTLRNRHGAALEEIYVSSASENDWGPDRLPGGIPRGGQATLTLPVDCLADIRVIFPNGAAEERREVDICRTPAITIRPAWTIAERLDEGTGDVAAPAPGSVRLRNAAAVPLIELYLDPPDAPAKGPDRLGATVLGAGEALDLAPPDPATGPGACTVRLTAVFRDGREVVRAPFDLCAGTETALP